MDYNIIFIILVFILISIIYYNFYTNINETITKEDNIEKFYEPNIKIDSELTEEYTSKPGFVNEIIPDKKEFIKEKNNLDNFFEKNSNLKELSYDKHFYKKELSSALPIANLHTNFFNN